MTPRRAPFRSLLLLATVGLVVLATAQPPVGAGVGTTAPTTTTTAPTTTAPTTTTTAPTTTTTEATTTTTPETTSTTTPTTSTTEATTTSSEATTTSEPATTLPTTTTTAPEGEDGSDDTALWIALVFLLLVAVGGIVALTVYLRKRPGAAPPGAPTGSAPATGDDATRIDPGP